jgi:regulator of protease activity HflC (stomatin/prohibitin superfamily)
MSSITIRTDEEEIGERRFRAIAGGRQSIGRTMGEALDALTAEWGDDIQETVVLIQRFQPDQYFTQAQYDRIQELLARRSTLTREERTELEALIDAEVDATVARTKTRTRPQQP